jgi:hypothetical protein
MTLLLLRLSRVVTAIRMTLLLPELSLVYSTSHDIFQIWDHFE